MKKLSLLLILLIIPGSLLADYFEFFDNPWPGFSDNTVIDFTIHDGAIWCITGNGISYTEDGGANWLYFDSTNGLITHDIASIYSDGSRLWLGMIPPEDAEAGNYLSFTDDDGLTWNTLMFDTVYDYSNPIFDITGSDTLLVFTSMVAGLFASFDGGVNWQNIYYSIIDSVNRNDQNQHTNHYFAAVADTLHPDSIVIWAGTANGLMHYIFAPDYARLNSKYVIDLATANGYVYICGDSGLTRLDHNNQRATFSSATTLDGLPGTAVTAAHYTADRLLVGTLDTLFGEGTGLAFSDDNGITFSTGYTGLDDLIGENKYPVDFVSVGDVIFMAGYEAGLYKTLDNGLTWTTVSLDADPASGRNIVHSLDIDSAYLWLGTDSGLVRLTLDLDNDAAVVDDSNIVFTDTETTGGRASKVSIQQHFGNDDILDSTVVWTILNPIDPDVGESGVFFSSDDGANWTPYMASIGSIQYDIDFSDSVIYLVGYNALSVSPDRNLWQIIPGSAIEDSTDQSLATLANKHMRAIELVNDTIYIGTDNGFAIKPEGSPNWKIFLSDMNPKHYSSARRYTFSDSLTGDWVNALAIHETNNLVWASSHPGPAYVGSNGITAISLDGLTVEKKYIGSRVWNFAFYNQNVFAASDVGLLFSSDNGTTWDTLTIAGYLANFPNAEEYRLDSVAVYGVLVSGDTVWVGTEEGAASIDIDDLGTDNWNIFRVYDPSEQVYAYPVPLSPYNGDRLTFHYPVPQDANVTIEVYDFAMNLVKRVVDSEFRSGGQGIISSVDQWNGRNGRGDIVAVGIYYFKVSLSTGETYWGKLAIMP